MERLILGFICILLSINSYAGLEQCKSLSKQSDLNNCALNILTKTNDKLSKVYTNYLSELTSTEQLKLRDSQKLWVQFKEKDCTFEASPVTNGSMYSYVLSTCLINRAENRIIQLENMANCKNGTEPNCL